MRKISLRAILADVWQPAVLYGVLFAGLGALLFVKLGSLLPGFASSEVAAYQGSTSLRTIFENPINAPFELVVHGLSYLSSQSYFLGRLAAAGAGLIILGIFCWLTHAWYGKRTAIFGTLLFGASAWFLHTARLGTPDILLFGLLALVGCGVWLKRTNNPFVLLLCFILAASLLYVPGMIWFIVFIAIWEWKQIDFIFKRHLWAVTLGTLLILAAIAPLALAIYHHPETAKVLAGLPASGWPQPLTVLQNLVEIPLALVVQSPSLSPEVWLGRLPVLDIFSVTMLALGAYVYLKHARLARTKLFAPILLVGWALVALGGSVSLTILLPFVYILIAVGVGFMLDRWFRIFPRNPIAQGLGVGLIGVAVLVVISFHVRHYFVAWPETPATKNAFTQPEDLR